MNNLGNIALTRYNDTHTAEEYYNKALEVCLPPQPLCQLPSQFAISAAAPPAVAKLRERP